MTGKLPLAKARQSHSLSRGHASRARSVAVLLPALLVTFSGCGSSLQEIPVSSTPEGAALIVDGQEPADTTPTKLTLKRGEDHVLTVRRDGFSDYRVDLKSRYDGAKLVGHFASGFGLGFGFIMGLGLSQMQGSDPPPFKGVVLTGLVVGAVCGGVGLLVGGAAGAASRTDYSLQPAEVNATLVPASRDLAAETGLRSMADSVELRNAHHRNGTLFYDVGRWNEAAEEFRRAYELGNDPAFLFNMALCYRRKGDIRRAIDLYKEYMIKAPDSPRRAESEGRIKALEQQLEDAKRATESAAQSSGSGELPSPPPSAMPATVPTDSPIVSPTPAVSTPGTSPPHLEENRESVTPTPEQTGDPAHRSSPGP